MKILTIVLLLSFNCTVWAQKTFFVRVYDLAGKKINKGRVLTVTDTSLQLVGKTTPVNILMRNIGFIRTKRSAGNNFLAGAIIGTSTMAIFGAASADPNARWLPLTAGEGAIVGAIEGLPMGAMFGGLSILFKKSKYHLINGDVTKWKVFQLAAAERSMK